MNDAQVIVQVMRGVRPPRKTMKSGKDIPEDLWHLVENCWSSQVKLRPSMSELVTSLQALSRPTSVDVIEKGIVAGQATSDALTTDPSGGPDPEVLTLVQNAFQSRLYKGLVLAARGELADHIMCTTQEVWIAFLHASSHNFD